jgi:hypothetical protein
MEALKNRVTISASFTEYLIHGKLSENANHSLHANFLGTGKCIFPNKKISCNLIMENYDPKENRTRWRNPLFLHILMKRFLVNNLFSGTQTT